MNRYNLYIYVFALVVFVFLGACSKNSNSYKIEPIKSCNFPDNPTEVAPLWVCNTKIDGFSITGIGSSPLSKVGLQFTTNKAVANARAMIAQELKTKVSNEIKEYIESKNLGNAEVVINVSSYVSSQITDATLVGSKILRIITSSNGVMYALVGLTEENYKSTIKETFEKVIAKPDLPKNNFLTNNQLTELKKDLVN